MSIESANLEKSLMFRVGTKHAELLPAVSGILNGNIKPVDQKFALGKIGRVTYNISLKKLFSGIAALGLSIFQTQPALVGLCFIAAVDSLSESVIKLTPECTLICDCFYDNYKSGKELEISLIDLRFKFENQSPPVSYEKLQRAIEYLTERGIIESNPSLGTIKFTDFYLFER